MKKIIILLMLLIPSTLAITLQIPQEREIIFESNKNVTLAYTVGNTDPQPLKVTIGVKDSELTPYIKQKEKSTELPPYGTETFIVELNFPENLPAGIHNLRIEASEQLAEGGMSGLTGAADIITVISPYENGYPYGKLLLDQYQRAGAPIKFYIDVQNIGKRTLDKLQPQVELMLNGQSVKRVFTDTLPQLSPFAKGRLSGEFTPEELLPGEYEISLKLGTQEITGQFLYGQPKIQITGVPVLKALDMNNFTATLTLLDWANPLENATVKFHVTNLLTYEQQMNLVPGDNNLQINAEARAGKSGTYYGRVNVNSGFTKAKGQFTTGVEGSQGEPGGVGFRPTPEEQTPFGDAVAGAEKAVKENLLLVIVLIAAFAIFSFALGRYMSRKRNQ